MDLKMFFDPVSIDLEADGNSFQSSIYINDEKMPDHHGMDIGLIGLNEYRGCQIEGSPKSADEVRNQLYHLTKGFGDYGIIDLGNFRNGPQLEDTYLRLKEVCAYLMEKGIIPILFGGSHDLDLGQFYAYESSNKLISMLNVDQRIDLSEKGGNAENHINKVFKHDPNYLFNYIHLAYQSYLTGQKDLELTQQLSFEATRLGYLKENIKEIEPLIRDADMLSFDLSALQSNYAPGALGSKIFGLTGEEACQISWYAGQNEKLSSIGFYNYDANSDTEDRTNAFVLSTMIWYFIEGFYHRKGDKNLIANDYTLYEVHLGGNPESIRFYKSKKSERWWMEVPNLESKGLFNRNRMVACSYKEYEEAQTGKIPDRWLNYFGRS